MRCFVCLPLGGASTLIPTTCSSCWIDPGKILLFFKEILGLNVKESPVSTFVNPLLSSPRSLRAG